MNLNKSKCEACTIDAPLVSDEEAVELLKELNNWQIELHGGIKQLVKQFNFSNYEDSVRFCEKVADLAEREDHHPKIILEYGCVEVFWWSHKIKGLHKNDFICAAKTDQI
tara:strand:+ start:1479 stop:1808 length:330 start_codon:yes stop_codon:yes gene_type:complete